MTAYSRPAVTVDLKNVIGPGFYGSHRAVREQRAHTLVEEGGRGSLKSSFCSVEIVLWLLKWPQSHALVMRQMGNTLEDSVYSQMLWAVAKLGLSEHFLEKKSPLRLIYKPTGQTIYFRGLDDEMKIKGIKPKFGYIGCLWFEEADQLRRGENAVLSVKQSAFRGSGSNPTLYEGAVQLIHNIYKNEYQLGREFELGRSRIVAGSDMLMTPGPEGSVMRLKDDVFVGLDGDASVGMTIFSPTLRDESFERRKQSYLKACENIIGLKRGILSDVEAVERTAKEISSSEGDYSLSVMDLQRMWYDALMETLRITDLWGQALGLCDAQAVDLEQLLSVSWGNGVLYDADKDWADTLSMVEAGLLKPELALAKKYDLPSETPEDLAAIREKYMPEMVQLTAQAGLR